MTTVDQPVDCLDNQEETPCFHIVGIGASAGGLEPLEILFKNMPDNTGMAFVVIQHLSPDFKSQMEQLLSRKTSMPIHRVSDGVQIEPDSIYLIPPKKIMIVSNGRLLLTDREPRTHVSLPIDEFFHSLAQDAGRRSIGVVLSGSGADGSRGVVSIAQGGGLVLAQDEESAAFDGMPLAAQATGAVSLMLPPESIPEILIRYVKGGLSPQTLREQDLLPEDLDMRAIFLQLHNRFNLDFSVYKASTVARRIKRRLMLTNHTDLPRYLERLENDPDEVENLYKDLLIGVTRFFRDAETFSLLENQIIPRLVSSSRPEQPLRIWVAACATGEEAYSLAILFHEQLTAHNKPFNIKIFATDVHAGSIKTASNGLFSEASLQGVSDKRRQRYFVQQENGYLIRPELRKAVSFATHNLITDAPFTRMDLVSCRNFLIYLQPQVQKKVLALFHFSLNSNAILMLGGSETLGELAVEFEEISGRHRIYRKKRDVRLPLEPRFGTKTTTAQPHEPARFGAQPNATGSREKTLLPIYDQLLDQFMPPAFLLDETLCIVHTFGGGEKFLRLRGGRTSAYFLDLIADEAKTSFAGALNHARHKDQVVNYSGIQMADTDGIMREHQVTVQPLYDQRSKTGYFFIKLTEQAVRDEGPAAVQIQHDVLTREHIETLETELRFSQENLQATIEELETANEELQASNEELVASNEELQSTNEELQSVNEELYTVNHEHQKKIRELVEAHEDMDNLLATTRVGVIFVDNRLCIRRYTPEIGRLFHLLPQDIGRSIAGFTHSLNYPNLIEQLEQVLNDGQERESEITDKIGKPYILRILPYRSGQGDTPVGVVITLVDISNLRKAQSDAIRFETISNLTADGNALIRPDGTFDYANPALCQSLGYSQQELARIPFSHIMDDLTDQQFTQLFERARHHRIEPREARFIRQDGSRLNVEISFTMVEFAGERPLLFIYSRDIQFRIETENELRLRTRALESSKNGIVICNNQPNQKILFANHGFYNITGYSADEVRGKNCRFLQGDETSTDDLALLRKAITAGEDVRVCLVNYRKDGEKFWNDLQISPVASDEGEVTHFIGVLNDVTQLRKAEEQSREDARKISLLINSTAEGIIFIDRERRCVFCNASAARLLNYPSPEDIVGQPLDALLCRSGGDKGCSTAGTSILESLRTGETRGSDAEYFQRRNGESLPVEYWSHPIVQDGGEIEGSVLTFIDITQRKRQQLKLRTMQEKAELASKAKSDFLANVSHELRTPLAAIMGYTELLQGDLKEAGPLLKLATLRRNSQHLLDLMNDILDLSKIESGFLAITTEECELIDLLTDCYSMADNRAREKQLDLRFDIGEGVPAIFCTDPIRCRQILTNLLSNALKYTDHGEVTLAVKAVQSDEDTLLEFLVCDTGQGIEASERDRLFRPFTRGSNAELHTTPGSGLGLSISQQLAHQLGGNISYESEPGKGSQFQLVLPLKTADHPRQLPPGPFEPHQSCRVQSHLPTLNCQVLVVDDHDDIRSYLMALLRSCNAIVTGVSDGKQALDLLARGRAEDNLPDVVLMDIQMPGVGGRAAVEMLRQQGIKVPVIAITAGAMKGERERCLLAGFDDYLSKPVDVDLLLQKIGRLLLQSGNTPPTGDLVDNRELAISAFNRVLVVEDSIDVAMAVKELLSAQGYVVETAYDGQSALSEVQRFEPHAVLMDIGLPDINGFEVIERIRKQPDLDPLVVIAMTGYSDRTERRKALDAGFNDYLIKPVSLTEMTQAIVHAIQKKQLEHSDPG